MSFLVLVITNFAQKEQVNRLRRTHPSRSKYGLVHYTKGGGKTIVAKSVSGTEDCLDLPDDMPIVEAYFRYVDQDVYSSGDFCRKMLSLDGDTVGVAPCGFVPCMLAFSVLALWRGIVQIATMLAQELLTALLMLPVANLGAGNQSGPKMCDITVADILGPKVIMNKRAVAPSGVEASGATDRDANFSLLSYSFSLVHSNSNLEPRTQGVQPALHVATNTWVARCSVEGGCGAARVCAR